MITKPTLQTDAEEREGEQLSKHQTFNHLRRTYMDTYVARKSPRLHVLRG